LTYRELDLPLNWKRVIFHGRKSPGVLSTIERKG